MLPSDSAGPFRRHQWHNGWNADKHATVWTCTRCGHAPDGAVTVGGLSDRAPSISF
jgi:hypothetical protein